MKISPGQIGVMLLLAFALGYLGSFAAGHWMFAPHEKAGMHAFIHRELRLTGEQTARLEVIEGEFAVEHRRLEANIKAANASLAQAMDEEHQVGPKVQAAIDEVHARMGDLQKATIRHVFKMRALLNPSQQRAFDKEVRQALTTDQPE